jgi:hypothetical protein
MAVKISFWGRVSQLVFKKNFFRVRHEDDPSLKIAGVVRCSIRIHRGFHRIGMTLFVLMAVLGALASFRELFWYIKFDEEFDYLQITQFFLVFSVIGIGLYIFCRTIGWIIAGFLRE